MRVLFITRKWPPAVGGMETWSAEVAAELRRDHALIIRALPGRPGGGPPTGLQIALFGLRTALTVRRRRHEVAQGGDMAVWPLVWLARAERKALAAHGTDVGYAGRRGWKAWAYRQYMRPAVRMLGGALVIANSEATAAHARALGFRDVRVVPLATRRFLSPPGRVGRFLLFAGRLVPRKGCAWFVREVLPKLPEDMTLKVAGTVWDEGERSALDHPRVKYLGSLSQDALARLMGEALAVVVPNIPMGHLEGFGLVAVEAAAAGGVVLAPRMDGFTDSVLDGQTGFLLPAQDADAWASMIREIAGWSAERRAAFTARSLDVARQHFNWERVAAEIVEAWVSTPSAVPEADRDATTCP